MNYPYNVLMIHVNPCVRVLKEIKALQKFGIHIDVLCKDLSYTPEIGKYADSIFKWTTIESLQNFLEQNYLRYDIIHCHNEPNDFIAITIAVCRDRPVVYDCHDFSSARNMHLPEWEALAEKICFMGSSAVIHVSEGMKSFALNLYGPKLSIVLPSLPSGSDRVSARKQKLDKNHIVYQGSIWEYKNPVFSYRYYVPFFRAICKAGIYVHVFPARNVRWEYMPHYMELSASTPYLHLYQPLPYPQLVKAMSQFQWGLVGFNIDNVPEETKNWIKNALPNKLFDYLYAGVCPIVINNETSAAFVEKHRVGYHAKDIYNLIDICKNQQPLSPVENFDFIDMDVQIEKLVRLYDACITDSSISIIKIKNKEYIPCHQGMAFEKEANSDFYNHVYSTSQEYKKDFKSSLYFVLYKNTFDIIVKNCKKAVLEIGCGVGTFASMLYTSKYKCIYTGFDFSDVAITMAKEKCPHFSFFCDDIYTTELYKKENYDVVVIHEVLEHLLDDTSFLKKIKPGTLIIASVPKFDSKAHVRFFSTEKQIMCRYKKHIRVHKILDLNNMFLFYGIPMGVQEK